MLKNTNFMANILQEQGRIERELEKKIVEDRIHYIIFLKKMKVLKSAKHFFAQL